MELSRESMKVLIKEALTDLLVENKELFREIFREMLLKLREDAGMKAALDEVAGSDNTRVDKAQIFDILDN